LLVDDEPSIRLSVTDVLREAGHRVTTATDGAEAMAVISARVFDVVILDIKLPKVDGLTIFRRLRAEAPTTDVILVTGYGAVADAVSALKEGAHDYLTKPFDTDEIALRVGRIAQRRALAQELEDARAQLASRPASAVMVGGCPAMVRLVEQIETMADSAAPVLITGESGTGKELVARSLHERSSRRAKPFVALNCGAFPDTLLEAELFGHERGAFSGAVRKRDGRFKAADGGTLLLDEIAEISPPAQVKLLRVLQEGTFEPLGTNESLHIDVRILSSTHRNIRERIADGRFREDLYYRLNVLDLALPPLRARRGDLPLLVAHFLRRLTPATDSLPGISPRAWAALEQYPFPGNVRELEHAIHRAVVLARGEQIDLSHLPGDIVGATTPPAGGTHAIQHLSVAGKEFEREYLLRALGAADGKRGVAAELLGISRKNLWEKLRAHGISDSDLDE
jgi:DNA-binding NtrC family response regulator